MADLVADLLQASEPPPDPEPPRGRVVLEEHKAGKKTLRLEKVKCGKAGCKSCPHPQKGAGYWYAYWRQDGRLRSKYLGRSKAIAFRLAETLGEEASSEPSSYVTDEGTD